MRGYGGRRLLGTLGILLIAYSTNALATPLAFAQSPGPLGPRAVLTHISRADRIVEGRGARHLTVFVDPNCPYCHKLFMALQPLIGPDHLSINWVVVGILRRTSPGKAAAILGAARPLRALEANERAFSLANGGGAIHPVAVQGSAARGLERNDQLFSETEAEGVPVMLFMSRTGRTVMIQGLPPSAAAIRQTLARIASRGVHPRS